MAAVLSSTVIGFVSANFAFAENNGTAQQLITDFTGFHSNIEQIKGHIEMAAFNKFFKRN